MNWGLGGASGAFLEEAFRVCEFMFQHMVNCFLMRNDPKCANDPVPGKDILERGRTLRPYVTEGTS